MAKIKGEQIVVDSASEEEHRQAAGEALKKAKEMLGKTDVLVVDEVLNAIGDGLIDLSALIDLISIRGETHVVLTGRGVPPEIVEFADLVTQMKKVKHPYDKGKLAVRGLDF